MQVILKYGFLFGILVIPFIYWPVAPVPFEIPRVDFFCRWIEILGLLGLFCSLFNLKKEKTDFKMLLLVLLFLSIAVMSSLLGPNLSKSFWGNYYRGDGLWTLFHLVGLYLFLSLYWRDSWLIPLFKTIVLSSLAISLWTISSALNLILLKDTGIPNWFGAVGVSFGQPNFLAGFLLVCLPFYGALHSLAKKRVYRLCIFIGIICNFSAIYFSQSRMGLFGIVLFLVGWLLINTNKKKYYIIGIFGLLILFIGVALYSGHDRANIDNLSMAESRQRIITKGVLGYIQRPFLGWGWANFDYGFESVDWPFKFTVDVYVDKAHSSLLETLVTVGPIGLIIYLGIIAKTINNLRLKKDPLSRYLLFGLIVYLVHSQTNVISISEELFFWMFLGIASKTKDLPTAAAATAKSAAG